jgi:hypothetical protein
MIRTDSGLKPAHASNQSRAEVLGSFSADLSYRTALRHRQWREQLCAARLNWQCMENRAGGEFAPMTSSD